MSKDVTLPSGVVVRLSAVPSMTILAVTQQLPEPKVPIWHNPDKDRDEPNPIDPEYLEAVKNRQAQMGQITTQAYLANGVKVVSIPEDKHDLDDDTWVEGLEIVGIPVRRSGIGRYVDWLQYHILGDYDLGEVITGIAVAGGTISEDQVAQAVDSFRVDQNGAALTLVPPEPAIRQRDTADNDTGTGD